MNTKLDFFDVSSLLEEISEREALTFKGGESDIAYEIDLEEVEITAPSKETDDSTEPEEDPDPFDDPFNDPESEFDEDFLEEHGGGETTPEEEEEPECTCDLGSSAKVATGDIKDSAGLLGGLKTYLTDMKTHLNGLTAEQMKTSNISKEGRDRMLGAIGKVEGLIGKVEDSNRVFRFESSGQVGNGGGLTKDVATGEYVISIDQGNNTYGVNELLVHELVHASQALNGEIGFDSTGSATMVGMEDEIAAYQMMYDFGRGAVGPEKIATESGIKAEYPGIYDNLPASGGSCPVHGK